MSRCLFVSLVSLGSVPFPPSSIHTAVASSFQSKGMYEELPQGIKEENSRRVCVCVALMWSGRESWLASNIYCLASFLTVPQRSQRFLLCVKSLFPSCPLTPFQLSLAITTLSWYRLTDDSDAQSNRKIRSLILKSEAAQLQADKAPVNISALTLHLYLLMVQLHCCLIFCRRDN